MFKNIHNSKNDSSKKKTTFSNGIKLSLYFNAPLLNKYICNFIFLRAAFIT